MLNSHYNFIYQYNSCGHLPGDVVRVGYSSIVDHIRNDGILLIPCMCGVHTGDTPVLYV